MFLETVLPSAKEELLADEIFQNERNNDKDNEFLNNILLRSVASLKDKEWRKLKAVTRYYLPSSFRVKLWMWVSGGDDVLKECPAFYQETSAEVFHDDTVGIIGQQEVLSYYLTAEGGNSLCKVAYMIKYHHPEITQFPLLEPVIGILLHFMEEHQVYACITAMLMNKTITYFDQTKVANVATDAAFQDLLKNTNKNAYYRLSSFISPNKDNKKTVLLPLWRLMMFENLEFLTLVRLMDCFMVEGCKILYRTGLYIMESFFKYSLTFNKLHCSSPHDLVTTIGQHTNSLKLSSTALLKACNEIDITSKKINSLKVHNEQLYYADLIDCSEHAGFSQVIAVDLNKVSDIISANQWQDLCEWLPAHVQVMQPFLLFTTHKHGYNLKTLYDMCEDEEHTLIVIQTASKEIFGAFLSRPLCERFDGINGFFGTGETFIFKLFPTTVSYHWNRKNKVDIQKSRKKRKYVFIDTVDKLNKDEIDHGKEIKKTKSMRRGRSFKKSIKRSLSSNFTKSSYINRDMHKAVNYPLSSINVRHNAISVPRNMYLGNLENADFTSTVNVQSLKDAKVHISKKPIKFNIGEPENTDGPAITDKQLHETDLCSLPSILEENTIDPFQSFCIVSDKEVRKTRFRDDVTYVSGSSMVEDGGETPAEMFICGDDQRLVIGGGDGEALCIDRELNRGRSARSNTFFNAPLTSCENGDFTITRIDVFGFQLTV